MRYANCPRTARKTFQNESNPRIFFLRMSVWTRKHQCAMAASECIAAATSPPYVTIKVGRNLGHENKKNNSQLFTHDDESKTKHKITVTRRDEQPNWFEMLHTVLCKNTKKTATTCKGEFEWLFLRRPFALLTRVCVCTLKNILRIHIQICVRSVFACTRDHHACISPW